METAADSDTEAEDSGSEPDLDSKGKEDEKSIDSGTRKLTKSSKYASAAHEKDIWDPELEEIAISSLAAANRRKFLHREVESINEDLGSTVLGSSSADLPVVNSQTQESQSQPQLESHNNTLLPSVTTQSQSQQVFLSQEESTRLRDHIRSTLSRFNQSGRTSIEMADLQDDLRRTDPAIMAMASQSDIMAVIDEMKEQNILFMSDDGNSVYII